jgi:hypothetical protein
LPNAIKAGILDPRHSREVQRRLSVVELIAVRDAIVTDTLLLYQTESLHDAIESTMKGVFDALMQRLRKASKYDGPCLSWWRELKGTSVEEAAVFSHYFRAARIFLSKPAGGAPSESVFSSTTDMVTKKRNTLGDTTLEQMTIVRHFVRSPRYKFDVIAKKIAATATQQLQMEAGKRARAMVQEEDEGEREEVQVSDE